MAYDNGDNVVVDKSFNLLYLMQVIIKNKCYTFVATNKACRTYTTEIVSYVLCNILTLWHRTSQISSMLHRIHIQLCKTIQKNQNFHKCYDLCLTLVQTHTTNRLSQK